MVSEPTGGPILDANRTPFFGRGVMNGKALLASGWVTTCACGSAVLRNRPGPPVACSKCRARADENSKKETA